MAKLKEVHQEETLNEREVAAVLATEEPDPDINELIDKAITLMEVKKGRLLIYASPQHRQAVAKLRAAQVLIRVG